MQLFKSALSGAQALVMSFVSFGRRIGWWKIAVVGLIVFFALFFGAKLIFGGPPEIQTVQTPRLVEVRSVAELASQSAPLSIVGTVSATAEANVRAESSGQVIAVYHSLGDYVGAGTVIAELENASQRAAVLQAQGAVDAAQAAADKVKGGTRSEQLSILQSASEAAKSTAVNSLLSAYATIDSAVRSTADPIFSNPESATPHFSVTTPNTQFALNSENKRLMMGPVLAREKKMTTSISASSDLESELTKTESEARQARDLLDTMLTALNSAVPSISVTQAQIDVYIASTNGARTALTGALSGISGARQGLLTSQKNLEQGVTGAQTQDVAASLAALKQAQGGLAAARAALEKTIIRSPISGSINALSLKKGDYVGMTSPVFSVANNGALEITAFVTQQDVRDITIGDKVTLDTGSGVVTRIAQALDPITKKIEVRIGVSNPAGLVNGQSVIIGFKRKSVTVKTAKNAPLSIPIAALKVGADDMTVFTVTASSTLESHVVTVGTLLGDRVEIRGGLTPDMSIVTDARGLRAGQVVQLK